MPAPKIKALVGGLAFCATLAGFGAEGALKSLPGHVPAIVFQLTPRGDFAATNSLSLAIGLPMRDPAGLDNFLAQVYDPASPGFHHFLTPDELTARFGPSEQDYEAVKNFARTNGLAITGTYGSRLLLDVRGSAGAVEQAFHVTLRTYHHPAENRDFFAPDAEPQVDVSLPIADVSGLENYTRPHPKLHRSAGRPVSHYGSAPNGYSYLGSDFRSAYVPGTTLDGSGQMVGLVQFEGYYTNDIAAYAALAGGGRTNIVVQPITLDGFDGTPNAADVDGIAEVSLDIEMAMSMAPGLSQIVVFEGNQNNFLPNDVLMAMTTNSWVKNLSSSWGWNGGPSTTTDNLFKTMAAQGQSYFNASGDSDAFPPGFVDNPNETTVPSSSPYITQVGGTTLSTTGPLGSYTSETVWNWGYDSTAGAYVGASGGVSTSYPIPAWQQGINSFLTNGGSTTGRNIPDVALTGDNVYVLYGDGQNGDFGGTSCAAPLWAGFMALVNQQAAINGKPSVGFINPAIYELANESIYASVFNDITAGNNTWPGSPAAFYAVPGYDLCTGVGTPAGTNLINALINPDPLVVISNAGFTAVSTPAGTFNISARTFYLTNAGAAPLTWSLIDTPAWLTASTNGGVLAPGASSPVVVGLNTVASNLTYGVYTANVWFTNVTSGVGHSRFFALQVADPLAVLPTNNFLFISLPGGPVAPAARQITLTNGRSSPLNWSLNNTSAWFAVSLAGGSLGAGSQTNLTVTPTPAALALPLGTYTAVLQITNETSQTVQPVTVSIVVAQSLVQNGGFETGDFSDWTLIGDGYNLNYVDNGSTVTAIAPHSGTYFAALGEDGYEATLSQTLPAVPNQKYLLSLWYDSPNVFPSTPNQFTVYWNGAVLYNKSNIRGNGAWANLQYVVTATGSSAVLEIGARDDNYYLGLDDVTVTPGFPPVVSLPPAGLTVLSGSNAVFTTAATGSTNKLAYRWTKNGATLANGSGVSGATSATLTLTAVTTNSAANYAVVITNLFGGATSSVAMLTVVLPPSITSSSLTNRTLQCGGNNATFTFTPAGTPPLDYQWSLDGTPVANATNTSFSVTNLHLPNHLVGVTITNPYASFSSNALLTVQDTLAPVITLNGNNPVFLELGSPFTDPGATATDLCSGAVGVTISGTVNTGAAGTNTLIYIADDGDGNTSSVPRTVIVRDTTPPTILWSFTNLVLAANSNCVAFMPDVTGTNYLIATDLSGSLTNSQSPTNDAILLPGTNTVVITVQDPSGNAAYSTNTVVVQDETPPVITLNGSNPMFAELGQAFVDPGATANDACAGIVPVSVSGTVNAGLIGTNTLLYTANDGNGNTNTAARTVIVRDTTPPVIVWSFTNLVLLADSNCVAAMPDVTGTNYIIAADLSGVGIISQAPTNDAALPVGTNVIVIGVADIFGNTALSTNTIVVQSTMPPVITLNGSDPMFTELGQPFVDPGATAETCAAVVPVALSGTVNTGLIGTNTLLYTADDGNGDTNTATRTVIVRDTTPPTILWSFTNLVLAADSNCVAAMPDVTGTNYILATDLSGVGLIAQTPTNDVTLPLGSNTIVIAVADPFGNTALSTNLIVVQDETPPVIVTPPQSVTNNAGSNVKFTVTAAACTPLAFQWFFDQSTLTSQTNSALVVSNISLSVAGNYAVVVSAAGGSTTSAVVVLTVYVPPDISRVAANPDGSFALSLIGSPGYTYIVEAATNLALPVNWLDLATNTMDSNGVWQFTDPQATNFTQQFYRLLLAP